MKCIKQDDLEGTGGYVSDEDEVTALDDYDNYVGAEVHLPVGEVMQHETWDK